MNYYGGIGGMTLETETRIPVEHTVSFPLCSQQSTRRLYRIRTRVQAQQTGDQ